MKNTRGTRQPMLTGLRHYYCYHFPSGFFIFFAGSVNKVAREYAAFNGRKKKAGKTRLRVLVRDYFLNLFTSMYIKLIFYYFLKFIFNLTILKINK